MLRLLEHSQQVESPFKAEGNVFWGNIPPFAPREFPAGIVYQRTGGEMGHEIGEEDATPATQRELHDRLEGLTTECPIVANKNPYNTVRLPWIRELFPESIIIAMVRRPVPNVFSLLKKHIPHKGGGLASAEGWWGVKPRGWRSMISKNKVIQCVRQWKAVNEKLWNDRRHLDMIISYHELCASPSETVQRILMAVTGDKISLRVAYPPIRCFDLEYTKGSRLRSKNRYFKESRSLVISEEENIELDSFTDEEISRIERICGPTASLIEGLG